MSEPSSAAAERLSQVQYRLAEHIARLMETTSVPPGKEEEVFAQLFAQAIKQMQVPLSKPLQRRLYHEIRNEVLGFGPIQPLLDDPEVSEIMVNGPKQIWVECKGKLTRAPVAFADDAHVMRIIQRIVSPLGRRVDEDHPMVDARLPDGSRVNAVVPPVAIDGPVLTIRKFSKDKLTVDQLIAFGSLTAEIAEFLRACVISRLNILISGGTGSGKTTLLNVLSGFIPADERIVTIEDAAELQLRQEHVVRLESRPPNIEGRGQVTIRDLVHNALRMRPDRIVVGEVRGGEALDMLQAMNTGHDGSLTTLHANSPRDAIARLETLVLISGVDLPARAIRQQIAAAIDLIIQVSRLRDGSRKVVAVTEVAGMEGNIVTLTDIFRFEQTGMTTDGKVIGEMRPTGIRPLFMPRLEAAGFKLPPQIFGFGQGVDFKSKSRRRR